MKERRDAPDPMKAFRAIALIITQRGEAQVKLKAVRKRTRHPEGFMLGFFRASGSRFTHHIHDSGKCPKSQ